MGQRVTSYDHLSKELHIGVQSIRTSLNKLKSTGELTIKKTNRYSIITINKWKSYQPLTDQPTVKQQSTNKQLTTNKNEENEKNEKKNTLSKDRAYGNPEINEAISYLKGKLGGSLDGNLQGNRRFAHLLIGRFRKDYPDKDPLHLLKFLIEAGLQDKFHGKNITSFKYLFYNAQKIIQSVKSKIDNPTFVKI